MPVDTTKARELADQLIISAGVVLSLCDTIDDLRERVSKGDRSLPGDGPRSEGPMRFEGSTDSSRMISEAITDHVAFEAARLQRLFVLQGDPVASIPESEMRLSARSALASITKAANGPDFDVRRHIFETFTGSPDPDPRLGEWCVTIRDSPAKFYWGGPMRDEKDFSPIPPETYEFPSVVYVPMWLVWRAYGQVVDHRVGVLVPDEKLGVLGRLAHEALCSFLEMEAVPATYEGGKWDAQIASGDGPTMVKLSVKGCELRGWEEGVAHIPYQLLVEHVAMRIACLPRTAVGVDLSPPPEASTSRTAAQYVPSRPGRRRATEKVGEHMLTLAQRELLESLPPQTAKDGKRLKSVEAGVAKALVKKGLVRQVGANKFVRLVELPVGHVVGDYGDCVAWCPACGPQCEHGENSLECKLCAEAKASK